MYLIQVDRLVDQGAILTVPAVIKISYRAKPISAIIDGDTVMNKYLSLPTITNNY